MGCIRHASKTNMPGNGWNLTHVAGSNVATCLIRVPDKKIHGDQVVVDETKQDEPGKNLPRNIQMLVPDSVPCARLQFRPDWDFTSTRRSLQTPGRSENIVHKLRAPMLNRILLFARSALMFFDKSRKQATWHNQKTKQTKYSKATSTLSTEWSNSNSVNGRKKERKKDIAESIIIQLEDPLPERLIATFTRLLSNANQHSRNEKTYSERTKTRRKVAENQREVKAKQRQSSNNFHAIQAQKVSVAPTH